MNGSTPPIPRVVDEAVLLDIILDTNTRGRLGVFLGAGCSLSANVPLARQILADTKKELFKTYNDRQPLLNEEVDAWLQSVHRLQDPVTAYGDALEWLRPLPRLRRLFLESYFRDKKPSAAHVALATMVKDGLFKLLYTTNFDDLLETALRAGTHVRVVSHDAAARDADLHSEIPTLFKLHGDFLFDSIANTSNECRQLPTWQEEKLAYPLGYGGLVVVGYAGWDESIMTALEKALVSRPVPLGLYWLALKGAPLAPRVFQMVRSHESAFYCPIDGFDQFVNALFLRIEANRRSVAAAPIRVQVGPVAAEFVAHDDGVLRIERTLRDALLSSGQGIVVITGRAGVGKTTLAHRVANDLMATLKFVPLGGERSTLREFVDSCQVRLQIPKTPDLSLAAATRAVYRHLAQHPTLLFLDDVGELEPAVRRFLLKVPTGSRVLITSRGLPVSSSRSRRVSVIDHTGLTDRELDELFSLRVAKSNHLRERFSSPNGDAERASILGVVRGWPQALLLLLNQLDSQANLTVDFKAAAHNISAVLFDGTLRLLRRSVASTFASAAAFPASFTVSGVASVSRLQPRGVRRAFGELVDIQWIRRADGDRYLFTHPMVAAFAVSVLRRDRALRSTSTRQAERYIREYCKAHGGQPNADWSNFANLDVEHDNLRALITTLVSARRFDVVTEIFRQVFSYLVERGHWLYVDGLCDDVLAQRTGPSIRADWLVWKSWIDYYLRRDYISSHRAARRALRLSPIRHRQRFQAHRRAALALAALGQFTPAFRNLGAAQSSWERAGRDTGDHVDLLNLTGRMYQQRGQALHHDGMLTEAELTFRRAEALARQRRVGNSREVGVAFLGIAEVLAARNDITGALSVAQRAAVHAVGIRWLRGIAESQALIARLALARNDVVQARSAQALADQVDAQLGRAPLGR